MKPLLAVAQIQSGTNRLVNLERVERLCHRAKDRAVDLLCFPENFAFLSSASEHIRDIAEPLDGPWFSEFRAMAKTYSLELSLGGFQEKGPNNMVYNSHVVVNSQGEISAVYRKIHLFVVDLPQSQKFDEAAHILPGSEVVVTKSRVGRLGLSICYDLRFGELYQALTKRGAQVLLVPSAFTDETGKAHWEVLLRARAIENQCYVAAAALFGRNAPGRMNHGHAMIVDPWGAVIAQCSEKEDLAVAEIDLDYLQTIRQAMPIAAHRRPDIFSAQGDSKS